MGITLALLTSAAPALAAIAKLSRNSRHTAVRDSQHEIHLSHPEAVITAILDVVTAVRERRPLR